MSSCRIYFIVCVTTILLSLSVWLSITLSHIYIRARAHVGYNGSNNRSGISPKPFFKAIHVLLFKAIHLHGKIDEIDNYNIVLLVMLIGNYKKVKLGKEHDNSSYLTGDQHLFQLFLPFHRIFAFLLSPVHVSLFLVCVSPRKSGVLRGKKRSLSTSVPFDFLLRVV